MVGTGDTAIPSKIIPPSVSGKSASLSSHHNMFYDSKWKTELLLTNFCSGYLTGFQELEIVYLITCLSTRSCTSHLVHLKQSFVYACTLKCTSPCTYYKDRNILEQKVNLRFIPLAINPESSLGIQTVFHRKRNNRQVSCLPRTKQPCNFPSTVFESNEYGQSFPVFAGLRQPGCQRIF